MNDMADPTCRRNSWLAALIAGLLVAAMLAFVGHHGAIKSLFIGALACVLLGFFLVWAFCSGDVQEVAELAAPARPEPAPAPAAETPKPAPAAQAEQAAATATASAAPVLAKAPEPAPAAQAEQAAATATASAAPVLAKAPEPAPAAQAEQAAATATASAAPVLAKAPEPAPEPEPAAEKPAAKPAPATKPTAKAKSAPAKKPAAKKAAPKAGAKAVPNDRPGLGLNAALAKSKEPVSKAGPELLSAPRGGKADDLKQIKGIGPKLEGLLNSVGVWHFDQIASWKAKDIAFVDDKMEGFKGRITRDEWVKQARVLARGGTTEFSARVSRGDVY